MRSRSLWQCQSKSRVGSKCNNRDAIEPSILGKHILGPKFTHWPEKMSRIWKTALSSGHRQDFRPLPLPPRIVRTVFKVFQLFGVNSLLPGHKMHFKHPFLQRPSRRLAATTKKTVCLFFVRQWDGILILVCDVASFFRSERSHFWNSMFIVGGRDSGFIVFFFFDLPSEGRECIIHTGVSQKPI